MRVYGLTGGIASGKTAASDYFATLGAHVVDTDVIAREVVRVGSPTLASIRETFGDAFFTSEGLLNRAKVKALIFNDAKLKAKYEAIIHPAIRAQTLARITDAPATTPYAIVVVPLLFEKGFDAHTDKNIVVDVPEDVQITRAIKRKPSDEPIIRNIIAQQMSRQDRLNHADFILENDQDLAHLYAQIDDLHVKLISGV